MNDQENLKQLEEALQFGFDLQKGITDSTKDGHVTVTDAWNFWPAVRSAAPAINDLGNPIKRYRELSPEGKDQLKAFAKEKFDIADDKLEQLIEDTFDYVDTVINIGVTLGKRWIAEFQPDAPAEG